MRLWTDTYTVDKVHPEIDIKHMFGCLNLVVCRTIACFLKCERKKKKKKAQSLF